MKENIFEAVIFDMDGVVIDTRKPIEAFWYELGEKHKIEINPCIMEQKIHGCPARQTVYNLFTHLSTQEKEALLERCEEFETSLEYIAMAGVKPFLENLKAHRIPLALVTSSLPPKVTKVIDKLLLKDIFDTIVTSDLIKKGKPDPACYLLAAQWLGKNPAQCVVFEDAVSGIKAATAAGMLAIGVGSALQEPLLKEVGATEVILNFEKIKLETTDQSLKLQINGNLSLQLQMDEYITK